MGSQTSPFVGLVEEDEIQLGMSHVAAHNVAVQHAQHKKSQIMRTCVVTGTWGQTAPLWWRVCGLSAAVGCANVGEAYAGMFLTRDIFAGCVLQAISSVRVRSGRSLAAGTQNAWSRRQRCSSKETQLLPACTHYAARPCT